MKAIKTHDQMVIINIFIGVEMVSIRLALQVI